MENISIMQYIALNILTIGIIYLSKTILVYCYNKVNNLYLKYLRYKKYKYALDIIDNFIGSNPNNLLSLYYGWIALYILYSNGTIKNLLNNFINLETLEDKLGMIHDVICQMKENNDYNKLFAKYQSENKNFNYKLPSDYKLFDNKPFDDKLFNDEPFNDKLFNDKPFNDKPYYGKSYYDKSFDKTLGKAFDKSHNNMFGCPNNLVPMETPSKIENSSDTDYDEDEVNHEMHI